MPRTNSIEIIRKTLDLAGHELQILHQISQTISCSLDPDQILRHIIDLVVDVTHGDSCLLYLLDETEQSLILRASKNPHPRIIGNISLKVGEGITGWVAREAKPVAIPRHASKDARFKFFHNLPEDRYEAFLSVPIIAPTDRMIGVINVQHRRAHRHTEQEITLLSIIGHQVGGAIENARLYQETSRRAQHLSALAQVGQIIVSGKYLEEMLQLIVSFVTEMMPARVCSIMLVDRKKNELVLKAAKCSSQEYWQRPNLKIGRSLISRVVKEKRPLIVRDVTHEVEYRYPELAKREGVRSLLSVPMIVKDHVTGVINIYAAEEREFSDEEVRLLSTVADQAALAIENTKLMVEAQESQEALHARKLVDRAKSILQRQAQLSEDEAYRRLQEQSMRTRRSMREIAEAVILAHEMQTNR
jgi:signal transduction protein with GAF and PtsI domain